jgi:hypothetical protein
METKGVKMGFIKKLPSISLVFLILVAFVLTACQKKEESLPSIFSDFSFGNQEVDIFFKKSQLKKYGVEGKFLITVLYNGNPQLALLDPEKQSLKILTKENYPNRAPSFAPDGKTIYYASIVDGKGVIKQLDLKSGKETTLLAGKDNYFDPIYFKDNKLILNVFPDKSNFYLATFDLKTKKLVKMNLQHEGVNLADRAAEPAYDRRTNTLYFVNDLGFDGKPKPINIWAYDLTNNKARKITSNSEIKTFNFENRTISSPQFYDISLSPYGNLLYCVRYLDEDQNKQLVSKKNEVHVLDLSTGKDRTAAIEATPLRQPIQISKDYVMISIPEFKEIVLVNYKKPHTKYIFLSLIEVVGDMDYLKP